MIPVGEIDVVHQVEIQVSVAIHISPGGTAAPALVPDAGPGGDIGEGAVSVVAIKNVDPQVEHVEIQIGVTVHVRRGTALPLPGVTYSRRPRGVLEAAASQVAVEHIAGRR